MEPQVTFGERLPSLPLCPVSKILPNHKIKSDNLLRYISYNFENGLVSGHSELG